jgi:tetratricopeptide (TPR) repeat protein
MTNLDTDELEPLNATREIARRAYLSNDRNKLRALALEDLSLLADYVALDAIRNGETPDTVPDNDTLKAVVASLTAGRAHPNALADPSAWTILGELITEEDAEQYPEQAATWQLENALTDIAAWQFESALTRARTALKWSHDEAVRDEALNIVGFVLYQQGNDDGAIAALEKALEGEYSANLQANIGIIAEDLRPEVAAHHLARLAHEAPTLDLKLAAVRHAFNIWTGSEDAWAEDGLVIPDDLLGTLRSLVVEEIPYDDYVSLMRLLSSADSKWLAYAANTNSGPHTVTAARKIYIGKAARDPGDYVKALADVSKTGNEEEWFVAEKTGFVESLRSMIFSEEGSIGPASYAFAAIDQGLELDDFDYVTLACGAAISIFAAIAEDESLPSDKVRDMVLEANRRARSLDGEQRKLVDPLIRHAGNQYGAVVAGFHAQVHDNIVGALSAMAAQMYGMPRRRVNWSVVENAIRPMRDQARDSGREVRQAMTLVTDAKLKTGIGELAITLEALASRLANPRRMF